MTNKLLIKTIERLWVEWDEKLNIFNYWWYRYFTNEFEEYRLKTKYIDETQKTPIVNGEIKDENNN